MARRPFQTWDTISLAVGGATLLIAPLLTFKVFGIIGLLLMPFIIGAALMAVWQDYLQAPVERTIAFAVDNIAAKLWLQWVVFLSIVGSATAALYIGG